MYSLLASVSTSTHMVLILTCKQNAHTHERVKINGPVFEEPAFGMYIDMSEERLKGAFLDVELVYRYVLIARLSFSAEVSASLLSSLVEWCQFSSPVYSVPSTHQQ